MLQGDGRIGTSSQGIGQEQTKQGGKEARYRTDQARCHFSETSQGGADTAKASLLIIIVHLITYSDLQTFRHMAFYKKEMCHFNCLGSN